MNFSMEQKLTAQIAAMYLGCKVGHQEENFKHPVPMVAVDAKDRVLKLEDEALKLTYYVNIDQCKLILAPLSEISDEDAIELCKITGWDYDNSPTSEAHFDLAGLQDAIANDGDSLFDLGFDKTQQAIDFLRSRGYDCGHGPIKSLIQSGIAIKKQ